MYIGTPSNGVQTVSFETSGTSLIVHGSVGLGNVVTLSDSDITWRIVHIDEDNDEMVLAKEILSSKYQFDSSESHVAYEGSDIVDRCNEFEQTLPQEIQDQLISKTVHGVTANVWIPQINWISNSTPDSNSGPNNEWTHFSYFTNNNNRIARDEDGNGNYWWTASVYFNKTMCVINGNGEPDNLANGSPAKPINQSVYFRPFICIPYKRNVVSAEPVYPASIPDVGGTLSWVGKTWIVVHKVTGIAFLGLNTVEEIVQFSVGSMNDYLGSKLHDKALDYAIQFSILDCDYVLDYMGGKVFVASYDQLNGDFSYFTTDSRRNAGYTYWTSSGTTGSSGNVWLVYDSGAFGNHTPTGTAGFRPFVALRT